MMKKSIILLSTFYVLIASVSIFSENESAMSIEDSATIAPSSGVNVSQSGVGGRVSNVDCLQPIQSEVTIFETQKEAFVDENRDVKEVLTDFVVKEFFRTPESLYNFLETTYSTINNALDEYRKKHGLVERAIFFIFKGGNVLKMLANAEILNRLPQASRALLVEKFGDYFKRSDADFSVLIDPNRLEGLDFDVVINDVVDIVANALNSIRSQFNAEPKKYFDFLQANNQSASSLLSDYMDELNGLNALHDPEQKKWYGAKFLQLQLLSAQANPKNFCPYIGGFDFQQMYVPKPTDKVISLLVGEKPNWLANSTNLSLEFARPGDDTKLAKFYLLREKVQFQLVARKDGDSEEKVIGGELIDVSIPHRRDNQLQDIINHYDSWIKEYKLVSPDGKRSFVFKSESIEGLLADIMEILFIESPRPWDNVKYDKRINRLFFLAAIDIFKTIGVGSSDIELYFNMVDEKILAPALYLFGENEAKQNEIFTTIKANADEIMAKWSDIKLMNRMWWSIANVLLERLINSPTEEDKIKFMAFIELLRDNMNTMKSLKNSTPGKIPEAFVNDINVTNLY